MTASSELLLKPWKGKMCPVSSLAVVLAAPDLLVPMTNKNKMPRKLKNKSNKKKKKRKIWIWEDFSTDLYHFQSNINHIHVNQSKVAVNLRNLRPIPPMISYSYPRRFRYLFEFLKAFIRLYL